jgi:MYXO-CTERM domain-containing protein
MVGSCRGKWVWVALAGATLVGCGEAPRERVGRAHDKLAEPGPWSIPPEVLAVGDDQHVEFTGAGPWIGEEGCYGGISPATDILRDYLYAHFPQTYSIGGYACRHINGDPSKMSVHATGRALDVMIETVDGEADNDLGDPIGNWLIENAETIGIQFIIWDLYTWMAARDPGTKGKSYGGAHPHHDHLHIELADEYADLEQNWFDDLVSPPLIDGCSFLPPEGGVVEETSPCFGAFGSSEFWRFVEGAGSGDSLLWTNAFENDAPSNWARWNLYLDEAGSYRVEVYLDAEYAVHAQAPYAVKHADGEDLVVIDQSEHDGWAVLGEWMFEAGAGQHVSVFDHVDGPVAADQRIAVDAVRVTRLDGDGTTFDPTKPEGEGNLPGVPSSSARTNDEEGGCSASGAPTRGSTSWWWAGAIGVAWAARRRRSTTARLRP